MEELYYDKIGELIKEKYGGKGHASKVSIKEPRGEVDVVVWTNTRIYGAEVKDAQRVYSQVYGYSETYYERVIEQIAKYIDHFNRFFFVLILSPEDSNSAKRYSMATIGRLVEAFPSLGILFYYPLEDRLDELVKGQNVERKKRELVVSRSLTGEPILMRRKVYTK